jgi:hypothetical protein
MESVKILLMCVGAAVIYGIAQDQITVRICVEYFTIGHSAITTASDPTTLAFAYGTAATWWFGLLLGVPLVVIVRAGSRPKLPARDLIRPIGVLIMFVGLSAVVGGIVGYGMGIARLESLPGDLAWRVPRDKHASFLADAYAHFMAYAVGLVGGVGLWVWAFKRRSKAFVEADSGKR